MRASNAGRKAQVLRHLGTAAFSALLVYVFYLSYSAWGVEPALWPAWDQDHPFWRAWAHAAFVLLFITLILAPAASLWNPVKRLLPWRRELGIWFAILSLGHAWAIWDRWAQGDVATLFGFQYVKEFDSYVLLRPEVGIMNIMGIVMLPMILLLAMTSFDRAVDFLGAASWKWLHRTLVPTIFYIAMLRGTLYFFFLFQVRPPEWREYPPIWFLYVFLGMGITAVLLQAIAFARIVFRRRAQQKQNGILSVVALAGVVLMLVMPLALMTGTVAYFDVRGLDKAPAQAAQTAQAQQPQEYAQTFVMTIRSNGQISRLWVRDLDDAPHFRVTVEEDGSPISHQVYRSSDRTLYTAERDPKTDKLVGSRREDVSSQDIGLAQMVSEPAAWAARYGIGEHQIDVQGGQLQVQISSVGEPISDDVFKIADEGAPN